MSAGQLSTANFTVAFNPSLVSAIQDRTIVRIWRDVLFPNLLFRGEAEAELWPVNLGANQTFTRAGLIRPSTRPLAANSEPEPLSYPIEQWEVTAEQWAGTIDTHTPTSYVSSVSQHLRNVHQLGLHAGMSLNRVVRDKGYNAYLAGNTVVKAGGASASTSVPVVSINGFTKKLQNGRPASVSPTNPLPVVITSGGVATTYNVVGYTLDTAGDEIHGGTLTLDSAHGGLSARDIVVAANRSEVVNSGGSLSIDNIASTDQFSLADIRAVVAKLRTNLAPVHEDGTYHCHLDAISEQQVFGDREFQNLNTALPDYLHYREFALAHIGGCTFYRNLEAPVAATVDQDPRFGATFAGELTNASSVPIHRPLFTAAGWIEEKYLDESKYITENGVLGKIGEFSITNGGMQILTERIRLTLRSPMDRLQQNVSSSWSYSGAWGFPTDAGSPTSNADYKRAVVVQHGE